MKTRVATRFADAVVTYISRQMFEPHRGVIEIKNPHGGQPLIVLFGNDAYTTDQRTKRYADVLCDQCRGWGWDAQLGISKDGYTWAIVVPPNPKDAGRLSLECFEEDLYFAYRNARGLEPDDGMMLAMKSIHARQVIEHTNGQPLVIPGWESLN